MKLKEALERIVAETDAKVVLKLNLEFLGISIEFSRKELLDIRKKPYIIEQIATKTFVDPRVMHYDLTKEDPDESIKSLFEIAAYLESVIDNLGGKLAPQHSGLTSILGRFKSVLISYGKKIRQTKREMDAGNNGEEPEFKLGLSDWLPQIVVELRSSTYLLVWQLIDLLPDNNLVKDLAEKKWFSGNTVALRSATHNLGCP